jgi:anti-sigma regulatory factor (Ser/Thr protein kinase)
MRWKCTYPPHEGEATAARADVARLLVEARLGQALRWEAAMVTDELVGNAIRHAGTEFTVTVEVDDEFVRITVSDWDPCPPVMTAVGPEATSGRGLVIVATLAMSWGFETTERDGTSGKAVWAALAIRPADDGPL